MSARKELLATIEQQRTKIAKYEKKLSDLVSAYKGLLKEKDALQASLSALTDSKDDAKEQQSSKPPPEQAESPSGEQVEESDCESTYSGFDTEAQELAALRNRVATLKSSLKTISTEKSRNELSLKEDRKKILEEKKKVEESLQEERAAGEKLQKEYDDKIQEMRTKVLVSHHEREQETNNAVLMLRELEGKLSRERGEKEKLERLLDESRDQSRHLSQAIASRNHEKHQKQITDLQNELEQVRSRLKKAEEQSREPPMLKTLQNQMVEMKVQYTQAIKQEQLRAESAERSARQLSQVHEERVAALEASLTELSLTAASEDRARQTHIKTIHSLKEKLSEVLEENKELASKASTGGQSGGAEPHPSGGNTDYNSIIENFTELWEKLTHFSAKSEKSFDVEGLLSGSDVIHRSCRAEYAQLKQDLERLRISNEKQSSSPKGEKSCSCSLKDQVDDLKDRVRSLTSSSQMTQVAHSQQVSALRKEMAQLKEEHEKQTAQLLQEHKGVVAGLEQQLSEHCQRSLATLQDRDEEIHRFTQEIHRLTKQAQEQPNTVAAALLSQVNLGGSEGPLLHHLEEMARKDLDISELRKTKRTLERTVRDIQMASIEKQQAMQDAIDDMQEEVARLKRNTSRKGENLEYLKNVVLQYMLSTDSESRHSMLKAIAAVLKFTPGEVESVRKFLALWWWQTPPKGKGPSAPVRRMSESGGHPRPPLEDGRNHPSGARRKTRL